MFGRLLRRSRASRTVEVYGWLIIAGARLGRFHLPTLVEQAEGYFRLVGLLEGAIGVRQ